MRRFSIYPLFIILMLGMFSLSSVQAQTPANVNWEAYSKSLVKALKSDNEGVKLSAMQQVIRYSDHVNVIAARFDVMDMFLEHDNQKVRLLALATLHKINNKLDMGLLERQFRFEEDALIQRQIAAVLIDLERMDYPASEAQINVAVAH